MWDYEAVAGGLSGSFFWDLILPTLSVVFGCGLDVFSGESGDEMVRSLGWAETDWTGLRGEKGRVGLDLSLVVS